MALAPSTRGPKASVQVDCSSGMPSLRDLAGVEADAKLCDGFLRDAAARPAHRPLNEAARIKAAHYERLRTLPIGPLWRVDARLRRVDEARGLASFEVVYDRYDPAEVVFTRHTILLEQEDAFSGAGFIERRGDYSAQTSAFRDKMERYTQDDSEFAFLLLGRLPGVRVEEITRGRVGPLWSPWAPAPERFRGAPEPAFTLHLPLDRSSQALEADRREDPFAGIFRECLSADSRELVEEEARRLGYRVYKDRKFAVTRGGAATLEAKLREAGARNIVYEV